MHILIALRFIIPLRSSHGRMVGTHENTVNTMDDRTTGAPEVSSPQRSPRWIPAQNNLTAIIMGENDGAEVAIERGLYFFDLQSFGAGHADTAVSQPATVSQAASTLSSFPQATKSIWEAVTVLK